MLTIVVSIYFRGFYVNKSNRVQFDPSPASVPHFSHNLLSLLLSVCGSLRTIWTKISERYSKSKVPVGDNKAFPGALDPIATLYDEGKSSLIYQSPQWLAAPASLVGHHEKILPHKFDTYRAQHELISEALGTEDLGVAREW